LTAFSRSAEENCIRFQRYKIWGRERVKKGLQTTRGTCIPDD
jgi:hypothetical protein